jgi:Kef-type K+ transport system membrane component KefB
MEKFSHENLITLLFSLSVMLIAGRLMAELARKLKQPPVAGEMLAGILLGPTVLGTIHAGSFEAIFPRTGPASIALDGIVSLAVILLLFVAGLEVELHIVREQGKEALSTSALGIILPFSLGFGASWLFPGFFLAHTHQDALLFSLFLGTALSITALPVIVRILLDLNLFKSKLGMLVIASAMVDDLIGWIIFSILLSMMKTGSEGPSLGLTVLLTLGFMLLMLTAGRKLFDMALPWIRRNFAWLGGVISLSVAACFLGAAFTEYIGIHSIFGAFIIGVALGDSAHLTERTKEVVHQFVNNIFAPLFFVSIGLKVNFALNFDLKLVAVVLALAFAGKVIGCGLGAYWGGFSRKESLAVGFGMNARGAMEIILGLLALNAGLINETLFVALVVMALLTSMSAGPLMKLFMGKERKGSSGANGHSKRQ